MAQFLTVMHDELMIEDSDDTIRAKVDEFLKEIVQLLTAFSGPKRKSAEQSDLVSQTDLDRFYSGIHTPWFLTTWICNAVEGWPQKIGVDPQKEPDKKIDVDKVQRICWKYYLNEKKAVVTKEDWLSPECTYRLFLLYNKLLLRDDTTDLEVGQVNAFLMKMVNISEYSWSPRLEYKAEGSEFVNFPEFVTVITEYFGNLSLDTDFTCELIGELYDLMVLGILKKGFLVKKGHVVENWRKRYFVLQLTRLKYYKDRDLTEFKGELVMNRKTKLISIRNVDSPGHPRMFKVTCGASLKEFQICAEDQRTKQSWILAIQKALALTKIRSPSNREEFVLSVAQWRKSVYGEVPDIHKGNRPPSNTLSMLDDMTDIIVNDLRSNRSNATGTLSRTTPFAATRPSATTSKENDRESSSPDKDDYMEMFTPSPPPPSTKGEIATSNSHEAMVLTKDIKDDYMEMFTPSPPPPSTKGEIATSNSHEAMVLTKDIKDDYMEMLSPSTPPTSTKGEIATSDVYEEMVLVKDDQVHPMASSKSTTAYLAPTSAGSVKKRHSYINVEDDSEKSSESPALQSAGNGAPSTQPTISENNSLEDYENVTTFREQKSVQRDVSGGSQSHEHSKSPENDDFYSVPEPYHPIVPTSDFKMELNPDSRQQENGETIKEGEVLSQQMQVPGDHLTDHTHVNKSDTPTQRK
jgi:hypothetical protein